MFVLYVSYLLVLQSLSVCSQALSMLMLRSHLSSHQTGRLCQLCAYRQDVTSLGCLSRPLLVQFCANDPETLLAAARQVEHQCDAVDINLGCPQRIARRGHYGAFLMDDWDVIAALVRTLADNLSVPVTCKVAPAPSLHTSASQTSPECNFATHRHPTFCPLAAGQ